MIRRRRGGSRRSTSSTTPANGTSSGNRFPQTSHRPRMTRRSPRSWSSGSGSSGRGNWGLRCSGWRCGASCGWTSSSRRGWMLIPAYVPWSRVAQLILAVNRLCAPGSELALEERWIRRCTRRPLASARGRDQRHRLLSYAPSSAAAENRARAPSHGALRRAVRGGVRRLRGTTSPAVTSKGPRRRIR